MLILLNSTKTMDLTVEVPAHLEPTEPVHLAVAQVLAKPLAKVSLKRLPDGSLRTAPVHSKMARGALTRYALTTGARTPGDLLGFRELGWETVEEPPDSGPWLFVRTYRG